MYGIVAELNHWLNTVDAPVRRGDANFLYIAWGYGSYMPYCFQVQFFRCFLDILQQKCLKKWIGIGRWASTSAASFNYICLFYSYGYVATATHFGLLTIWETGSLSMRHQCKHSVSMLLNCVLVEKFLILFVTWIWINHSVKTKDVTYI